MSVTRRRGRSTTAPTGSRPQRCPRCFAGKVQAPLHTGRTPTFEVHACDRCGGVWLDLLAAEKVLSEISETPVQQPPTLVCPACDCWMPPIWAAEAQVTVDRCQAHGVWFDARELEAVCVAAARRLGKPQPRFPTLGATAVGVGGVAAAAAASAVAAYAVLDASDSEEPSAGDTALDVVVTAPETAYFGAEAVGTAVHDVSIGAGVELGSGVASTAAEGASGAAELAVGGATEVASGASEVAVEAGSGFVEALGDVLGGLFS